MRRDVSGPRLLISQLLGGKELHVIKPDRKTLNTWSGWRVGHRTVWVEWGGGCGSKMGTQNETLATGNKD